MCGSEELSKSAFVASLQACLSTLVERDPAFKTYMPSMLRLMAWSHNSSLTAIPHRRSTLAIAPLSDLVEMFHTKQVTDLRDKVFALLGMKSDPDSMPSLLPDYSKSWAVVFRDLIEHLLGNLVVSMTWETKQYVIITATACSIGFVDFVEDGSILVKSKKHDRRELDFLGKPAWTATWSIRQYCKEIRKGDIVCLIRGSRYPTILRHCKDHFDVHRPLFNTTSTIFAPGIAPPTSSQFRLQLLARMVL